MTSIVYGLKTGGMKFIPPSDLLSSREAVTDRVKTKPLVALEPLRTFVKNFKLLFQGLLMADLTFNEVQLSI